MVRWRGRRQSDNVEDRRSESGRRGLPFPFPRGGEGGRGINFPLPGGRAGRGAGIGITGFLIILALMLLFGVDPRVLTEDGAPGTQTGRETINFPDLEIPGLPGGDATANPQAREVPKPAPGASEGEELARYVGVILADTEDVWNRIFQSFGQRYREPKLVLFSDFTRTRCGAGMAAMGPFYCPLDQTVYIDLGFYRQLRRQFGAPGDFAQAYVIAHEVGHHVQVLLGIADKVRQAQRGMGGRRSNALQVRMELQADCLAGVWANRIDREKGILEDGDIQEGLRAAAAIGDDTIQRRTQGRVVPDAFTHGTSEQRVRWFRRGLENGRLEACDTFRAARI
ncbi:MAG: neutral zinc metallopeptidase [Dichotomicrobium sp.]